jgi:hypothetical protein
MQNHPLPPLALILILWFSLLALIVYLLALQDALKKCAPTSRDEAEESLALAYPGFRTRLAIHRCSEHCKVLEERVRKTWNPLP